MRFIFLFLSVLYANEYQDIVNELKFRISHIHLPIKVNDNISLQKITIENKSLNYYYIAKSNPNKRKQIIINKLCNDKKWRILFKNGWHSKYYYNNKLYFDIKGCQK